MSVQTPSARPIGVPAGLPNLRAVVEDRSWQTKRTPIVGGFSRLAGGTQDVIGEFARRAPAVPAELPTAIGELTPREREVLDLLIRGLSNPEICRELVISEATTKTHVAHILQKLGLRDRVQAVMYAYEAGLVTPGAGAAKTRPPTEGTPGVSVTSSGRARARPRRRLRAAPAATSCGGPG